MDQNQPYIELIERIQRRIDQRTEETAKAVCDGRDAAAPFAHLLRLSWIVARLKGEV
jgi:hypothetical protein